jgi:hypothetical protein
MLQLVADQQRDPSNCQWLHFEVNNEGKEPLVILASQSMIKDAVARGHGDPVYMDASTACSAMVSWW